MISWTWQTFLSTMDLVITVLLLLFWRNPSQVWWIGVLVMFTRLLILATLVRGRVMPGLLTLVSGRVRIRSISFRSVRGLFLRTGNLEIHVDRIRFGYRPLGIKLEGVRVEFGQKTAPVATVKNKPRAFSLSVFELAPYPIARRLLYVLLTVVYLIDPLIRPIIRYAALSFLRLTKQHLPALAKSVDISASYVDIVLKGSLNPALNAQQIDLRILLEFTGSAGPTVAPTLPPTVAPKFASSIESWRKQMSGSLSRALDRTWGDTEIAFSATLKCHQLSGTSDYVDSRGNNEFFNHPNTLATNLSAKFRPRQRLLEDHSLDLKIDIQDTTIAADVLMAVLESVRMDAVQRKSTRVAQSHRTHSAEPSFSRARSSFHLATNSRIFRAFSAQHRHFHKRWKSTTVPNISRQSQSIPDWIHALSKIHIRLPSCRTQFLMPATATDILPASISISFSGRWKKCAGM
jgi:hypothetical protein